MIIKLHNFLTSDRSAYLFTHMYVSYPTCAVSFMFITLTVIILFQQKYTLDLGVLGTSFAETSSHYICMSSYSETFILFPHSKNPIACSSCLNFSSSVSLGALIGDLGGPRSRPISDIIAFKAATLLPSISPVVIYIVQSVHTCVLAELSVNATLFSFLRL